MNRTPLLLSLLPLLVSFTPIRNEKLPAKEDEVALATMTLGATTPWEMNFAWQTINPDDSDLEIVSAQDDFSSQRKLTFKGTTVLNKNNQFTHKVKATGLSADTTYRYRIGDSELDSWKEGTFKTSSTKKEDFSFGLLGDLSVGDETDAASVKSTIDVLKQERGISFLALNGNLVKEDTFENWSYVLEENSDFFSKCPLLPISGKEESNFDAYFNLPRNYQTEDETYYSMDYQGVHFTCLDSENLLKDKEDGNFQLSWLRNDLASHSGDDFLLVLIDSNLLEETELKSELAPLFTQYHVDLCLEADDSYYSLSYPLVYENNQMKVDSSYVKQDLTIKENTVPAYYSGKGTVFLNTGTGSGNKYDSPSLDNPLLDTIENLSLPSYCRMDKVNQNLVVNTYVIQNNQATLSSSIAISHEELKEEDSQKSHSGLTILFWVLGCLLATGLIFMVIFFYRRKKKGGKA